MELNLPVIISVISVIFCIATFVTNRKDKAVKDAKEDSNALIQYKLGELKDDIKTILGKLDSNEKETKELITEALELHIKLYHKGDK